MAECREEDKQMLYEAKASADSAHLRLNDHKDKISASDDGINEIKLILRELQIGQKNILERNRQADEITKQLDIANTRHRNELTTALRELVLSNNGQEVKIAIEKGKREAREKIMNTYGTLAVTVLLGVLAWGAIEIIKLKEENAKDNSIVATVQQNKVKARKTEREDKE